MDQTQHLKILFKAILDNMTDSIVLIDTTHKIVCFNNVIKETLKLYFGKEISEGEDYRDYVIEPMKPLYLESFDKAVNGETILVESETAIGDVSIWFQYKVNPVYDDEKRLLGVALTATNIDHTKRKEIALAESKKEIERKTIELATSENYFRTLIETSLDAIVLMDAEGKVLYQTPSAEKISGYSLQEIQSINGIEVIHPQYRQTDNDDFIKNISIPGSIVSKKHRLQRKDGKYVWIEGTYRNLLHDENVKAIVFNYSDITERETATHQLKERIKELSTIYEVRNILNHEETSTDTILQKIVTILPYGWQYPEICRAKIIFNGKQYLSPNYEEPAVMQTAPISLDNGNKGLVSVGYAGTKDTVAPFLTEEQSLIEAVANLISIHFTKTYNQQQLLTSEANLKSIFQSTEVGYLLMDTEFNVLAFNNRMLTGYAEETNVSLFVGDNFIEMLPQERRFDAKKTLLQVINNEKSIEYEALYNYKSEASFYNINLTPVINNNTIIGVCLSAYDITKLKKLEDEKQNLIRDLLQRNRDLEEFTQIMSHSIRGPLSSILGLIDILTEESSLDDVKFVINGLRSSSKNLDIVITELINVINLKDQNNEPKILIKLESLISDVKKHIANVIDKSNAIITCKFDDTSNITAVKSYVYSIFHQLILNSIKYNSTNAQPLVTITSENKHGKTVITYTDNCGGIDLEKYKDHVYKLSKKFVSNRDGNNLGLFMIQTLVEMLNGTLEIKSELGVGSCFTIELNNDS
jgi:PAS domain S-box-containing protein